ncbi:MAG: hypothetical protein HOI95_24150, partial [Chromatiales bacterium]|nr:hypothetical protein [Chromatiales bacterium]
PYAMEDGLTASVHTLKLTLGQRTGLGIYPVAVIAKRRLAGWLRALDSAGAEVVQVIPELLLLPWVPNQLTIAIEPDRVHLRWGQCQAASVNHGAFDVALETVFEHAEVETISYFGDEGAISEAARHRLSRVPRAANALEEIDVPTLVAKRAGHAEPLLELRGTYDKGSAKALRRWIPVAALSGVVGVCLLLTLWADVSSLSAQRDEWDEKTQTMYRAAFPSDGEAIDVERLMRRRLRSAGDGGGPAFQARILEMLVRIAQVQGEARVVQIEALDYRDHSLEITVTAKELGGLETWRGQLGGNPSALVADTVTAVATPGGARATIRVRAAQ